MKRGGSFSIRYRIELLIAALVLAAAFVAILPRFLHRQRNFTFVIENCETLDDWSVISGNWTVRDSAFETQPNPDGSSDWMLVHNRSLDATFMNYPVALFFDCSVSATPPPIGSIWIGLGFGWPPDSESKEKLPTLANVVRIEDGEFQGVFMRTNRGEWLGQYFDGPVMVMDPTKQSYRSLPNISEAYQLSNPNAVPDSTKPQPSGIISRASTNVSVPFDTGFGFSSFTQQTPLGSIPSEWYRSRCYLDGFDPHSGSVGFNLRIVNISRLPTMQRNTINGQTVSIPIQCFPAPRKGLVLFVRQTGTPIPIRIDNIRMRMKHTF